MSSFLRHVRTLGREKVLLNLLAQELRASGRISSYCTDTNSASQREQDTADDAKLARRERWKSRGSGVIHRAGFDEGPGQGREEPQTPGQGSGVPYTPGQGSGVPYTTGQGREEPQTPGQGSGVPYTPGQGSGVPYTPGQGRETPGEVPSLSLRPEDSFGNLSPRDKMYERPRQRKQRQSRKKIQRDEDKPSPPSVPRDAVTMTTGYDPALTPRRTDADDDDDVPYLKTEDGSMVAMETDVFGTLVDEEELGLDMELRNMSFPDDDNEDDTFEKPHIRLSATNRRHPPEWYGRKMEKLLKQGKVREALECFEIEMIEEDRVLPNSFVFTILLAGLGRVGYTKKAFTLFIKMKKMGIPPNDMNYTSLFNACANSPFREDGLERAAKLYKQLKETGHNIEPITYRAAVKAFARHGDLLTAFAIADEAREDDVLMGPKMFSALLMACVSDTEAGFKHAIEVWRRMRSRRITPVLYHYNLLLRAARECGVGGPEFAQQLIRARGQQGEPPSVLDPRGTLGRLAPQGTRGRLAPQGRQGDDVVVTASDSKDVRRNSQKDRGESTNGQTFREEEEHKQHKPWWQHEIPVDDSTKDLSSTGRDSLTTAETGAVEKSLGPSIMDTVIPNILNPRGTYRGIVSLGSLETRQERLALLGGLAGVAGHLRKDAVVPDVKTFTFLLDLIPETSDADNDLLAVMESFKVRPDTAFFNQIIRKRCLQRDYAGAKEVLSMMGSNGYRPDSITYGCLAIGCHNQKDGMQLINDLVDAGVIPTVELYAILMNRTKLNFWYKHALCSSMKRHEVAPNERILRHLEKSVEDGKKFIVAHEQGRDVPDYVTTQLYREGFRVFMKHYRPWLKSMTFERTPHPWDAYQVTKQEDSSTEPEQSSTDEIKRGDVKI